MVSILSNCSSSTQTVTAERKDIVESVYASATLKAADQYTVITPVSGVLLELLVKEGDSVSEGQVLARIENVNPLLSAENARLAVDQARNNIQGLEELRSQLATARRQFSQDSLNYERQKQLWNQNIGTKAQLETRQLAKTASANQLNALQVRLKTMQSQYNLALNQAENNLNMSRKNSSDFNVVSRMNGRIYSISYKPGEMISPQKPFGVIGKSSDFIIEMTVDEVDISRVQVGQTVVLGLDAYRDEVFEGTVSRIYPSLDPRSQSFVVEAVFVKSPQALYPGMSAEASIVIREKKNALVVPLDYLTGDSVKTIDGNRWVKTGLKNLEVAEILEGIDEKTELIKP